MNNSYITDYYNSYNEDERTKSRHGSVEFLTNMKYIRSYVPQGAKVLDVGAGTGVYSIALAMDGYDVHALELVEHNIEVFRSNLPEGANIPVEQGNALDHLRRLLHERGHHHPVLLPGGRQQHDGLPHQGDADRGL